MKNKTIAIYVFIDDLLKKIGHKEPICRKTTDAEIIIVALISGLFFHGHIDNAINFVKSHGYMPNMLSKSRFNRRIHAIYDLVINLFFKISVVIKKHSITSEYSIDSFPAPICENIRIARSKIVNGEVYRGFKASKRQYFYGFTVQIIATVDGIPVEFAIHPGSIHDSEGMKYLFFESLENSTIYGDSAYTGYLFEEQLKEIENIQFMIAKKVILKENANHGKNT